MGGGPIRICAGCRTRRTQAELLRVARRAGDVVVDPKRRIGGRGAYVCFDPRCVERALGSGALRRSLRQDGPLPEELRERLLEIVRRER
jgi:hypothetical protein